MLHTRTIREAAAWFKSQDPQTCLTETAIRTLLRSGRVPCVRVGKKYLVTIEALEAYLSGGETAPAPSESVGRKVWSFSPDTLLWKISCRLGRSSCPGSRKSANSF